MVIKNCEVNIISNFVTNYRIIPAIFKKKSLFLHSRFIKTALFINTRTNKNDSLFAKYLFRNLTPVKKSDLQR